MVEAWAQRLREGDTDGAWSLLLARYRRLIFATIRHQTKDPDEVMDAFAHVCEQLRAHDLKRLRRFEPGADSGAAFSTWLVVVVRNLVIDWSRAHRAPSHAGPPLEVRGAFDLAAIPDPGMGPEEIAIRHDTAQRLDEVLRTLDPDVRLAVQLFVVDEMPAAEIARHVGWPDAKTVYNRVYRALAVVRKGLALRGILGGASSSAKIPER